MRRYILRQVAVLARCVSRPSFAVLAWTVLVGLLGGVVSKAQEARWTKPFTTVEVPKAPADPAAAKVYAVFDKHCASCHQTGRGSQAPPAGAFGGILDLETIAADQGRVQPGTPDASPLYLFLQANPAHGLEPSKSIELTSSDLDAVREWISGLKPQPHCDRAAVSRDEIAAAVTRYLDSAGAEAKNSRFLSLTHLYNACASDAEMKAYRHATAITVNSLSWGLRPIVLVPVDTAETVFRIDLTAMGWDEGRWNRLLQAYPYRAAEADTAGVQSPSEPVRADWLAVAGLTPPLYYELLGLPDRLSTLTGSLRVDLGADVAQNKARRVGIRTSAIARGSRLLQRSPFANGGFWITYEYAPATTTGSLFDAPAGPGSRGAARPDGSLVMFSLPNGFNAFFMANGDGGRINDLPLSVLRNDMHPSHKVAAGAACLACHTLGPRPATDELKARVLGDASVPRDIREKVLALAAADDEMTALVAADVNRVTGALAEAGIVPGATLDGIDPVTALGAHYERDVTLTALAAELGVPTSQLRELAGKTMGAAGDVIDSIVHGPVPRASVEAAAMQLAAAVRPGVVPPIAQPRASEPAAADVAPRLVLKTGPVSLKVGDVLRVTARATESCYLTLINVDRNGRGTVVFPNDFEQNNFIEAGKEIRVPADGAPYLFRLRESGRETVVGVCQTVNKSFAGIKHDFERQRFTELGDYKTFLSRLDLSDRDGRANAQPAGTTDQKARRRGRVPSQSAPVAPTPSSRGDVQVRATAIVDVVP